MRQCPVCKSETGDEPVCPVCGFDISCDYGRFPTLGADIPRDLKARASQRVKDAKDDTGEAEGPTGAPEQTADEPPVSLLSQEEIGKLTFRKGLYAFLFSIIAIFFFAFIMAPIDSVSTSEQGLPNDALIGIAVTAALLILIFALLKKTLKKMKPDEWTWKKQGDEWTVLPKEKAGTGKKKKMTTALMLLSFGWPLGLQAFYLDGFWGGVLHCVIMYGGAALAGLLTGSEGKLVIFGIDLLYNAGVIVVLFVCLVVFFSPMIRVIGMPPEFEKGEF